jgi:hypothetical protein
MTPPPGSWPPDEQQTERVRRQRALAERLAAQQQLDNARMASAPTKSRLRQRRRRPGNNRFVAILAVIALIATVLTAERWAGSGEGGLEWAGGTGNFGEQSTQVDRPTPQDDPSPHPARKRLLPYPPPTGTLHSSPCGPTPRTPRHLRPLPNHSLRREQRRGPARGRLDGAGGAGCGQRCHRPGVRSGWPHRRGPLGRSQGLPTRSLR